MIKGAVQDYDGLVFSIDGQLILADFVINATSIWYPDSGYYGQTIDNVEAGTYQVYYVDGALSATGALWNFRNGPGPFLIPGFDDLYSNQVAVIEGSSQTEILPGFSSTFYTIESVAEGVFTGSTKQITLDAGTIRYGYVSPFSILLKEGSILYAFCKI